MAKHSNSAIWRLEYLNAAVEAEVLSLPDDMQGRLVRISDLLVAWGPQRVGMPYTRPLGGKLWEIRLSGRAGIARVIYIAAAERRLVMLHAFVKKTDKTPSQAIELAERRAREIKP